MVGVCMGGTGSRLSLAQWLLEGLRVPRVLVLLPRLPALMGAVLSDAVTDPLTLAAQTHRSPPNRLEIGRVGKVLCEALVGRNDAAHPQPSRRELLSQAEVSEWLGAACLQVPGVLPPLSSCCFLFCPF